MKDQAYEDVETAKEKLMKGEMPSRDAPSAQKGLRKQVIDTVVSC
jgi:hypothetical protein